MKFKPRTISLIILISVLIGMIGCWSGCAVYTEPVPYYGPAYYGPAPAVIVGPTYYWGYHGPYYRGYNWHPQGHYYYHR